MQCPQCKSTSVIVKDGQKTCESKNCTFIEFHVITYENENRQFQGEKGTENRFNSLNGQTNDKQTPKLLKTILRNKVITNLISTMHLSTDLQDKAESKFAELLKLKFQSKISLNVNQLAAYSLWLACFDKKLYFKDVRIANQMGITKHNWFEIHKQISENAKSVLSIPQNNIELCVKRICAKRKINAVEEKAMLDMLKNMYAKNMIDGKKNTTFAGFIFWQIMSRSQTYNGNGKQFNIEDYLTKPKKSGQGDYWTQRQIQTSLDAIKKLKSEKITSPQKLEELIPQFATRKQQFNDR